MNLYHLMEATNKRVLQAEQIIQGKEDELRQLREEVRSLRRDNNSQTSGFQSQLSSRVSVDDFSSFVRETQVCFDRMSNDQAKLGNRCKECEMGIEEVMSTVGQKASQQDLQVAPSLPTYGDYRPGDSSHFLPGLSVTIPSVVNLPLPTLPPPQAVQAALAQKASAEDMAARATKAQVIQALKRKANREEVEGALAKKADIEEVLSTIPVNRALSMKADAELVAHELENRLEKHEVAINGEAQYHAWSDQADQTLAAIQGDIKMKRADTHATRDPHTTPYLTQSNFSKPQPPKSQKLFGGWGSSVPLLSCHLYARMHKGSPMNTRLTEIAGQLTRANDEWQRASRATQREVQEKTAQFESRQEAFGASLQKFDQDNRERARIVAELAAQCTLTRGALEDLAAGHHKTEQLCSTLEKETKVLRAATDDQRDEMAGASARFAAVADTLNMSETIRGIREEIGEMRTSIKLVPAIKV
ncbi:hypothetical protein PAPYR_12600 [Paratrimastix pyriformis]|uniref:Uncharacterized protein n=1 Tax=Paratrimastix pyriformis TaxID=342808 RepID=A0ABQ8U1M3_9EUKA|nr:hypothetical protein PAPYR_12600 [Paratrimastix pyriformis]